jgi:hypothetical protein
MKILEPERTLAYARHTEGTADLIRHRSPTSFTSPYEQTLFLAHIGPALSEAFYNGEPCYLARPEWIELYTSLAEDTPSLTDRCPLMIRIRKAFLYAPGMFVDTSRALSAEGRNDSGFLLALELKTRSIHRDLLHCLEDYKTCMDAMALTSLPESVLAVGSGTYQTSLVLLGVFKRMLAAICEADRLRLEAECQVLAVISLQTHEQPSATHSWLHAELGHRIALILQDTRSSWEEDLTCQSALEERSASHKRWEIFYRRVRLLRL